MITEICPIKRKLRPQFVSIVPVDRRYIGSRDKRVVAAMCMMTTDALTLNEMLQDPLIRAVMRSDNVSEQDFSELMLRVQGCLLARQSLPVAATVAYGAS